MSAKLGRVLRGRRFSYQLIQALKGHSVFKTKVLHDPKTLHGLAEIPEYATLKTPPTTRMTVAFDRERKNYELPGIANSSDIRSLIDIVDSDPNAENGVHASQPQCMVFEWMDTDIWSLPSERYRSSKLPKIIARSLLQVLITIQEQGAVHTDVNPNNVFVSAVETTNPICKLGDLGTMVVEGYDRIRLQGVHCRAPELAHWLANRVIFGHADKVVEDEVDAWCIAKIIRLAGPIPPSSNPAYNTDFELAEYFERESFHNPATGVVEKIIKVGTIREELTKLPGPSVDNGCIDFVEHLLVTDHSMRPTARDALGHFWLRTD